MTKNISLSDIKDISKQLYNEYIEHGYKIKFQSEEEATSNHRSHNRHL